MLPMWFAFYQDIERARHNPFELDVLHEQIVGCGNGFEGENIEPWGRYRDDIRAACSNPDTIGDLVARVLLDGQLPRPEGRSL
jgi:hypothetical protein